jgi:hypothetical protein
MPIKGLLLVCTLGALAGAAQAVSATVPSSPETDGNPGCDKSSPLYPSPEAFGARTLGPLRAKLRGGAWTCVGRDENGELIRRDWIRESTALSYYYEWGATSGYGSRSQELGTVRDAETGIRSAFQAVIVESLRPGRTYHYRVVVRSDLYPGRGWRRSEDATFTQPNRSTSDRRCTNPRVLRVGQAVASSRGGGTLVTIAGRGLGTSGILTVGGRRVEVERWSPSRVVVRVATRVSGKVVAICGSERVSSLRTPDAQAVRLVAGRT